MQIVEEIRQNLAEMTRSERAVASFILANRREAAFATLEKIARTVGVSTTSVIRFCRRIGFSGYKAFQEAVRHDVGRTPDLPDKFRRALPLSREDQLLEETLRQTVACVETSFAEFRREDLARAVTWLKEAKRVFTFGMKESFAPAHYASTRFLSVRPEVWQLTEPGRGEVEALFNLGRGDLCVVFLFRRYTRLTRSLLPAMRKRGARVILITDPPAGEVEDAADLILPCRVDAGGIKNSFAAPVALTDYLCGALAFARGEAALAHMRSTEALFRESGVVEG
ncbi:MAG: MurR/RpiR family transcriptional regulator [Clostridia bacterium]|nr:MurR/RpiR family transcriptional regulator [Clostridia bacterium]